MYGRASAWRDRFDEWHGIAALGCLGGLVALGAMASAMLSPSPAPLLVTGALMGMPHGSSDFVAGYDLLRDRLGSWWLPTFLAGYLAITGVTLTGWWLSPAPTLLLFLGVSALHFGAGPWDGHDRIASTLRFAARALTPVLPIFLLHRGDVAGILALLGDASSGGVEAVLQQCRMVLIVPYLGLLAAVGVAAVRSGTAGQLREALELGLLAAAAAVLPPFLTFAVYFCGLHAVRHLGDLGARRHPADGQAALGLALRLVVPSALVCGVALASTWDAIAGAMTGTAVLCVALRIVAALTVPHMLLEWWWAAVPVSSADRTPPG